MGKGGEGGSVGSGVAGEGMGKGGIIGMVGSGVGRSVGNGVGNGVGCGVGSECGGPLVVVVVVELPPAIVPLPWAVLMTIAAPTLPATARDAKKTNTFLVVLLQLRSQAPFELNEDLNEDL